MFVQWFVKITHQTYVPRSICVGDQRHTTFISQSHVFSFGPGPTSASNKMSSGKFSQVVDLVCFLIVGLVSALLGLVIPSFRRGFFCNDESIKYPYTTKETFPTWALLLVSVVLPVVTVSNSIQCIIIGLEYSLNWCLHDSITANTTITTVLNPSI